MIVIEQDMKYPFNYSQYFEEGCLEGKDIERSKEDCTGGSTK